jgi:hypothetical protein
MKKLLRVASLAVLTAAAFAVHTPPASAAVICQDQTLTGTVTGPVLVPAGSECIFSGATVNGSVVVQPGGRVVVANSTTINGSLALQGGSASICQSTITGNLLVANAPAGEEVFLGDLEGCPNRVGGSVVVANNAGGVSLGLTANVVHCSGNNPPPTGSIRARLATGQCAGLVIP